MSDRDNWYRTPSWTLVDQEAFFLRLRRARPAQRRAQLLRIKASFLKRVGTSDAVTSALTLLELSDRECPTSTDRALTYELTATCLCTLGRPADALPYFIRALEREHEYPGIQSNACFTFAAAAATHSWREHYHTALEALDAFGVPVFPWHAYMAHGARAIILADCGGAADAHTHATLALKAADISYSGFPRDPDLGLVSATDTLFHRRIRQLAGV